MKTDQSSRPPLERHDADPCALERSAFPELPAKWLPQLEVSPKTIQRDIDFMRYRLGLPIAYDPLRFGFYLFRTGHEFSEHRSFRGRNHRAVRRAESARAIQGNAVRTSTALGFPQDHRWPDRSRFICLERSRQCHLVSQRGRECGRPRTFRRRRAKRCCAPSRSVSTIGSYTARDYELRLVQPYHLASIENQWYLFGDDLERGQLRTFALPRMRDVRLTSNRFPSSRRFFDQQDSARKFRCAFR